MGGKGSSPKTTPAEIAAGNSAQKYLAQYNSGKLDSSSQAAVNLQDTNSTLGALQSFANAGMSASSAQALATGLVTPGTDKTTLQAGAGSSIDLTKLSKTQSILNSYQTIGQDYLQIESGPASSLAADQQAQADELSQAIGQVSQSFASYYDQSSAGTPGIGADDMTGIYNYNDTINGLNVPPDFATGPQP